jgi:hypothetical protein
VQADVVEGGRPEADGQVVRGPAELVGDLLDGGQLGRGRRRQPVGTPAAALPLAL